MNNTNLTPFDFEKAKAGKPVITRDGRKVSEMFFPKTKIYSDERIISIIDRDVHTLCE